MRLARSREPWVIRAAKSASPTTWTSWSTMASGKSSQVTEGRSPLTSMRTTRTPNAGSEARISVTPTEIGSTARGKRRARTRPVLPVMARAPLEITEPLTPKMMTPMDRKPTKLSIPRRVPSRTPKMRK